MANGEGSPWPGWARATVSAALGFGSAVVVVTLFVGDVRSSASAALRGVDDHEPRIRAVESFAVEQRSDMKHVRAGLDEVKAEQRAMRMTQEEILRRLPPR